MTDARASLVEGVRRRDAGAVVDAIAAGADLKAQVAGGLLHVAAGTSSVQVVRELVAAGADLDARDRLGRTALFPAASYGGAWMVRVLVAAGVDPAGADAIGLSAPQVARDHTVIEALEEAGVVGPRRHPIDLARMMRTGAAVALVGKDLREQRVSYGVLRDQVIRRCDLRGATLEGCRLTGTRVEECRLDFARLISPRFDAGTVFSDCSLTHAAILRGSVDGATFERCDLRAATLTSHRGAGVLVGCDLREADLSGVQLDGWVLRECALAGVRVGPQTLQGCRVESCDLSPGADKTDVRSGGGVAEYLLRAVASPAPPRAARRAGPAAIEAVDAVIARMQRQSAKARALPEPAPTLHRVWTAHASSTRVTTVVFDAAGMLLATATSDGALAVWDAATGARLAARSVQTGTMGIVSLSFQRDPSNLHITVSVSCMGDTEHEHSVWRWRRDDAAQAETPATRPDGQAGVTIPPRALSVRRSSAGVQILRGDQVVTVVSHLHVWALWPADCGARLALGAPGGDVAVYVLSDAPQPGRTGAA